MNSWKGSALRLSQSLLQVTECSKCPLAARDTCFRANFAGFPTLFFQIVFSLESARSSVGACAVVDIGLSKYVNMFSGHSDGPMKLDQVGDLSSRSSSRL